MKENDWDDCIKKRTAREASPDIPRAESLSETAKERISLIKDVNEKNCNFVFEDYYTSIMEILQAISFRNGYNIINHLCLGFYLRYILKQDKLFQLFDDLRYKRNSLTYYGSRMDFETAKETIANCKKIMSELSRLNK